MLRLIVENIVYLAVSRRYGDGESRESWEKFDAAYREVYGCGDGR